MWQNVNNLIWSTRSSFLRVCLCHSLNTTSLVYITRLNIYHLHLHYCANASHSTFLSQQYTRGLSLWTSLNGLVCHSPIAQWRSIRSANRKVFGTSTRNSFSPSLPVSFTEYIIQCKHHFAKLSWCFYNFLPVWRFYIVEIGIFLSFNLSIYVFLYF